MARNDTGGFGSPPARLGPMDVQQKEFRVSRFGGYKMRDVDEFLDALTTSMGAIIAENDRLREQAGSAPIVGSPDLDDVSRQADEIIQRARDEADRILADARAGAAATRAIGAGSGGREAVDAFLVQEREFLQGLAALVQGHAESVKSMARASRDAERRASEATVPPVAEETPVDVERGDIEAADATTSAGAAAGAGEPSAVEDLEDVEADVPAADGATADERPEEPVVAASGDPEATIRIDDPQPARAGGDGDADGSLRELFWGEED